MLLALPVKHSAGPNQAEGMIENGSDLRIRQGTPASTSTNWALLTSAIVCSCVSLALSYIPSACDPHHQETHHGTAKHHWGQTCTSCSSHEAGLSYSLATHVFCLFFNPACYFKSQGKNGGARSEMGESVLRFHTQSPIAVLAS